MANPTVTVERYIGGGRLYFTPYVNNSYGAEVEIGEVKDFKLSITTETADALSKDTGMSITVEEVTKAVDTSVSFTTQNLNKENVAMALMGTLTTETFAIGDTLPDGTVAAAETTVDKITGAAKTQLQGKLRMVSEPINDSAKRPVLVAHVATVRPSDGREYIVDDFSSLGFDGKILKTNAGYFDEYLMAVA